ncbi:hypothetical protein BCR34DRAFT_311128 [Clohesyomyces aquaticus]|uniref:Enoyl reductase (ER) domain-containing protein n=1 Tax=Clohesyomyces aquaticus TaxID=1231657 RepID=A0A1Y1ZP42_9PLEO|nr:hypothetical protein BCR34DRAFT_311128 [Clohesyomyces aquaticus]
MPPSPSLPPSSKSLTYTHPSSAPHITFSPLTPPGPAELLIKVHAAAINPVDIQLWGNPVIGLLAGKKEKGIGCDYSGVIVGVGKGLKDGKWEEGAEVFGLFSRPTGEGTFSQYIKVTPSMDPICIKPSCWTHEEAAAVPLVALTAFACLDWLPAENASKSPRRVVVAGASGGVGIWCVQLSKLLHNAHVTAICSSRNTSFARSLGADEIIDYTSQPVAQTLLSNLPSGIKYDQYIDCVGGTEMFEHWDALLHKNGSYTTIVGDKTSRTSMGGPLTYITYPSQVLRYIRGYIFGPRYANVLLYAESKYLEKLVRLTEEREEGKAEGKGVKLVVQDVVEGILDEGAKGEEAWEKVRAYMVEGRVRGKIVVSIEH